MNRNAVICAALVGLGLAVTLPVGVSLGENAPTTKPSRDTQPRGPLMRLRDARDTDRPRPGFGGVMPAVPSDEEWKQILSFLDEHSKNRLNKLNQFQGKDESAVRTFIATRYRALMAMKEHDPEMYDRRLKQFELEDNIIGQVDASESGTMSSDDREAMKQNVVKLVQMNLDERQDRIERLQKALNDEQARLDEDRSQQDAMVQKKLEAITRNGSRALMMDGPRMKRDGADRDKPDKPANKDNDTK